MLVSVIEDPPSRWPLQTANQPRSTKMRLSVVHNILMIGPPGAGKMLLARATPSILPHYMTVDEALDVTRIYSVPDQLPPDVPLVRNRLFRAPHHTISHAGFISFSSSRRLRKK